jgi:hypothetical protein
MVEEMSLATAFMNNSEKMDYSRTKVVVAARQWLMKM